METYRIRRQSQLFRQISNRGNTATEKVDNFGATTSRPLRFYSAVTKIPSVQDKEEDSEIRAARY